MLRPRLSGPRTHRETYGPRATPPLASHTGSLLALAGRLLRGLRLGARLALLLREDLLHDLLLLDEEGADDARPHAHVALGAAVGARDAALAARHVLHRVGADGLDAAQHQLAVAALREARGLRRLLQHQLDAGRADLLDLVALGVVPAVAAIGDALRHGVEGCGP